MSSTMEDRPVSSEGGRPSGQAPARELRIHGVGGATPEGLLGVASAAETVRVGGGPISGFWARRDEPEVEGHVWGGLTTQSTFQPFWLLLLPFTLLNIAGFMHRGHHDDPQVTVQRWMLRMLGYALTATWALWTCTIVVEQLAWRLLDLHAALEVGLGTAGCLVLLGVGFAVARHTTSEFEAVPPPVEVREGARTDASRNLLEDPDFFYSRGARVAVSAEKIPGHQTWTGGEVRRHTGIAFLAIVGAGAAALARVLGQDTSADEPIGIGALLVPALAVQLALLVVLALASGAETVPWLSRVLRLPRVPRHGSSPRWLGPSTAAALAVGLTQLSFGGVAVFVGSRLLGLDAELAALTGRPLANAAARPEQAIADVVGLAIVFAVVGAAGLLLWHYPARPVDLPDWVAPTPARRLAGLPSKGWARRVARAEVLTGAIARIGWVLVPPAVAVLAYGPFKAWPRSGGRFASWADLAAGRLAPQGCTRRWTGASLDWLVTGCGGPGVTPTRLGSAGAWIIGLVLVGGPFALYRAARSPRVRALVGTLWDVLTFWPRWHHPFAVRSYSERAVPELQHRIVGHVARDEDGQTLPDGVYRPLVLSVHSQGTVLAFAALASLPTPIAKQVRVVSFGSPLSTLYAHFYPAYFGHAGHGARGGFALAVGRAGWWENFYRRTDYVGQQVVGVVPQHCLSDPYHDAGDPWPSLSPRVDEAPCLPWTRINGHSGYRQEPKVQAAVMNVRCGAGVIG